MKNSTLILMMVIAAFHGNRLYSQHKTSLHLTNTFHIKSGGGWDYLTTCPLNNWLYVSHATQVNILDKKTGDSVGVINNTTGVHGIAFDAAQHKGFTSNGMLNTVTVFDVNDNKILDQINVGKNPDAIFYEAFSKKIITCNGSSNDLSIIDPATNKVIKTIAVGGKPETAVSDLAGKLYVNIEDKNKIAVVDLATFSVIKKWPLKPGEGPSGLAIDPITKRLFSSCDQLLVVVNTDNGTIVDKLLIGAGCDGVVFDEVAKNIYTSNGEGTMTVVHEDNADKFAVVQNMATKKGARTIAIDPLTHKLYLPTADFDHNEKDQKGRAKMIAGTFQVLVFEK